MPALVVHWLEISHSDSLASRDHLPDVLMHFLMSASSGVVKISLNFKQNLQLQTSLLSVHIASKAQALEHKIFDCNSAVSFWNIAVSSRVHLSMTDLHVLVHVGLMKQNGYATPTFSVRGYRSCSMWNSLATATSDSAALYPSSANGMKPAQLSLVG